MKRPFIIILVVILVGIFIYFLSATTETPDPWEEESSVGYVSEVSVSNQTMTIILESGVEVVLALSDTDLAASNGDVISLDSIVIGDIIDVVGINEEEGDLTPSEIRTLAKVGPPQINEEDADRTFYYGLTSRFSVILPTVFPDISLTCTPDSTLGKISPIPIAPSGKKVIVYEAVERGTCLLTSGEWSVAIQSVEAPDISVGTSTLTTTQN